MFADNVTLLDGGLSTALANRGHRVGGPLWTGALLLTEPDAIVEAHRDFVAAGAEVLITASYQISYMGGRKAGWSDADTEHALRNSTIAARLASVEGTLVAASIGPYGAALNDGSEFRGGYGVTDAFLRDFHSRRLDVLLDSEPDLLAIETQPELQEIDLILSLLAERDTDIPLWVTCTVAQVGRIAGGASWEEVVARVEESDNAIAVGVNCSATELIGETLREVNTPLPYIVYPNHGQEWDATTESWVGAGSTLTDAHLEEWHALGVRMVGGCCGFDALEIGRIANSVQKFNRP